MAQHRPQERGNLIKEPKKKQGLCLTCDDVPKDRVSAEEIWLRAKASPVPYKVRIDSGS